MSPDELLFFDRMPQMLPLYAALRAQLVRRYPDLTFKVSKTQISFRNRYLFAMVSLPVRRIPGWPRECLLVSFGLPAPLSSPRIAQAVQAYPNRWTHHVPVQREEEIDGELLGWLDEAYAFSNAK